MKSKTKDADVSKAPGTIGAPVSTCPLWDDAQILQEDWGSTLAATPAAAGASGGSAAGTLAAMGLTSTPSGASAKESKAARTHKESGTTGPFLDAEGRACLEEFISWGTRCGEQKAALSNGSADEPGALAVPSATAVVEWRRPLDIMTPFRPVVHRNSTPLLDPYAAAGESPQPFDAKREEALYRGEPSMAAATAGGTGNRRLSSRSPAEKGGGGGRGATGGLHKTEPGSGAGPWHQLYPETVSLMDDLVGHDAAAWRHLDSEEAVRRYRQLPELMGPYDPLLVCGCAESPAEAVRSRYSTALRHKLQQAETLASLDAIPPFLMAGFNSALTLVATVQRLIAPGDYLWELIYPHAPGTPHPVYNPHGKYAVKLFIAGQFRKVVVDDALPVDQLGRPFLTVTSHKELWPAILAKALFKALGSAAWRTMTTSPEEILSCLMGHWVPEFVNPKRSPVSTAALFATYGKLQHSRVPRCCADAPPAAEGVGAPTPEQPEEGKNRGNRRASARGRSASRSTSPAGQQPMSKAKETVPPEDANAPKDTSVAEEPRLPADEEHMEKRPLILCGVRSSPTATLPVSQLYAVTVVAKFRQTVAVRVVAAPYADLAPGVFARERDVKDVQSILLSEEGVGAGATTTGAATRTGGVHAQEEVWLTLEELSAEVDNIVVWRDFSKRYAHTVTVDGTNSTVHTLEEASSEENGATSTPPITLSRLKRETWFSLTSDTVEEVAIIARSPLDVPGTESATACTGGENAVDEDSAQTVSAHAAVDAVVRGAVWRDAVFECYRWDRVQPLSRAFTFSFAAGKTTSRVFTLRPGPHIYRVTFPDMNSADQVSLHTNKPTVLKGSVVELLGDVKPPQPALFHIVNDAGVRPAVERADEEVVWLKRRFQLTEAARVTITLSTLPSSADPAAHRFIAPVRTPSATVTATAATGKGPAKPSAQKGTAQAPSGAQTGAAASTAKLPGAVPFTAKDLEGLDDRPDVAPVLEFTQLMLYNLDDEHDVEEPKEATAETSTDDSPSTAGGVRTPSCRACAVGSAGQLAALQLGPNKLGYLIMAHTVVPASVAATMKRSLSLEEETANASTTLPADTQSPCTAASCLYGKGLWSLTLRSDKEIQAFEAVQSHLTLIPISGRLRRGGESARTLLRYRISVTEPTHLSLLLSLTTTLTVPFTVTVRRAAAPTRGASQTNRPGDTAEPANDVGSAEATQGGGLLFSALCQQHAFMPDVLLTPTASPPPDQNTRHDRGAGGSPAVPALSSSAVFVVEATVSSQTACAWEEMCRAAHEAQYAKDRNATVKRIADVCATEKRELAQNRDEFVARLRTELLQNEAKTANHPANGGFDSHDGQSLGPAGTGHGGGAGGRAGGAGSLPSRGSSGSRRSMDRKKASSVSHAAIESFATARSIGRSSFVGESALDADKSGAAPSSLASAPPGAAPAAVDSTPEDLVVAFSGQLSLSSARAEVRNALPTDDAVTQLRALWANFNFGSAAATLLERGVGAAGGKDGSAATPGSAAGVPTKPSARLGGAAAQQQQQQLLAQKESEERQRVERGRQSRALFLSNPKNAFRPFLAPPGSVGTGSPVSESLVNAREGLSSRGRSPNSSAQGPESSASSLGRRESPKSTTAVAAAAAASAVESGAGVSQHPLPLVVLEDSPDTNFPHAPPLPRREYSVKLLPLRAFDVCPTVAEAAASTPDADATADRGVSSRSERDVGRAEKRVGRGSSTTGGVSKTGLAPPPRPKERLGGAVAKPGNGVATGASGLAAQDLQQQEEAQRAERLFQSLLKEPLDAYSTACRAGAAAQRAQLCESKAAAHSAALSFWERFAERKLATAGEQAPVKAG